MPYRLGSFADVGLDESMLDHLLGDHLGATLSRLDRLWTYYRNPLRHTGLAARGETPSGRWYRLAQEVGLPPRITGVGLPFPIDDRAASRREIVVENDIAWRVHTMVDFMFGRPVQILSTARDEATRRTIQRAIDTIWEESGGISLLQDIALLGHIFGHVDLIVRENPDQPRRAIRSPEDAETVLRGSDLVRIEAIDPRRGVPVLDPLDHRRILAYAIVAGGKRPERGPIADVVDRVLARLPRGPAPAPHVLELISPSLRQVYAQGNLIDEHEATLLAGRLPIVHIQNVAQPLAYEGLGEVEPLIPLQDELNTRLSDRASRVTMQSFKMYLAKGIDGFEKVRVGPGQIWSTDNPDAEVKEFGGDASSPSESAHIQEIREALDKQSGVPPLASGVVRAKIGNLTSANALRITMMGIIARTMRKRVTYGRGIVEACRLVLGALDAAGVLRTDEADRGVKLEWPDPLPIDQRELVEGVRAKADLGVPREQLLAELGYAGADPGVQ